MPRTAYVNGRYVPHDEAAVHIEDRGFQFSDGVYEVVTVHAGRLVDEAGHMARLDRSLSELRIDRPMSDRAMDFVMRELIRRNHVRDGYVYLQVTRGSAPREFRFPENARPTVVMTTRHVNLDPKERVARGVAVITIPDIRWKRRDIKSISLLPQALGKQAAVEAGAFEAWMVDEEGRVTEGCSSNAWIVNAEGVLVTRRATHDILNGITRQSILRLIEEEGLRIEERSFSVDEAHAAREAFLTSATTYVQPIVKLDGRPIGDGKPGPIALKLREAYVAYARDHGT